MLNLVFGDVRSKARAIHHAVVRAGIGAVVVEENIEPERHLVSIVFSSPIVSLLQRGDEQFLVWEGQRCIARIRQGSLTKFCDLRELASLGIIQDFTIVAFARNIDAEYYRLVDHLIEMNCGANVLWYLGLGINEKIARDVHQLDQ